MMFNNISNRKNKSRKDFLQKELEFYTNLLAQHEKKEEKNLPCTSTFFIQQPACSSKPSGMFTFNKVSDLKSTKEKNPLIQTTVIHNSSSKMTFSKHRLKKVINGSQLDKSNSSSIMYNTKTLAFSNAGFTTKLLMNQEASKKSNTLMGEIKAVTEQLKSRNSSRFKKINSLVKVEGKKDLQDIKQSSIKNNSYSNLNKVVSSMENVPKLLYTENNAHRQKGNLKSHTVLLEKMNAVKNLLNATTKNSASVLNKAKKNLLVSKTKLNYNCMQKFVKSSNLSASQCKNLSRPVDKFLQKQDFRLNSNNSSVQKSLFNQMSKESIKTQYKVVNKGLSTSRNVALQTHISSTVLKNCRLGNTPKSCSKRIFVKNVQNSFSPPKKTPKKVCKKYISHFYRSAIKHRQNPTLNKSYKLSKNLLENVVKSPNSSTGVDVDLLLELAAENKKKLPKSRKRLYKSKNRLINSYSVQGRAVKLIKAKYFNPYKKFADSKYTNKSFKGYRSDSNISKSSESFLPKFKYRKCPQKKIVNLGIKSTKLSSHGKSYMWKPVIKTLSPVSKMIASRALNRSINQATRKKMQKINAYCMFYNRFGRCNKGIKCAFVHDPSKIAVCTRFLRGTCKSEKCLFSHEINPGKMAICSFFLQNACTKKDCPYLHEQLSSDAELCKAFVQGYCPNGKNCKKAHILICTKFLRGQCDKGKDCIFPHPVKKEILINPKSCVEEKDRFQLETVLRYFESNPQESLSLVVPSRVKSLPQQQDFISLEKSATLFYF